MSILLELNSFHLKTTIALLFLLNANTIIISETLKMNKTKAYRRLKKKQKQTTLDWIEPTIAREKIIKLPLRDIQQLASEGLQRSSSLADLEMFGLRNFIEVVDLEKEARPETTYTSLPTISTQHKYIRNRPNQRKTETPRGIRHEEFSSATPSNGYAMLQAKLNALILPTPIKRKASRSFSDGSTGFHGRKMATGRKENTVAKSMPQSQEESSQPTEPAIQFPIASKMRQLLTIEPIDQPTTPSIRHDTGRNNSYLSYIVRDG